MLSMSFKPPRRPRMLRRVVMVPAELPAVLLWPLVVLEAVVVFLEAEVVLTFFRGGILVKIYSQWSGG